MTDTVLARLAALKTMPIGGAEAAVARPLRDASRRSSIGATSKAASPTASRNWPTAA